MGVSERDYAGDQGICPDPTSVESKSVFLPRKCLIEDREDA